MSSAVADDARTIGFGAFRIVRRGIEAALGKKLG